MKTAFFTKMESIFRISMPTPLLSGNCDANRKIHIPLTILFSRKININVTTERSKRYILYKNRS